jgi:hypothetical protein
MINGRIYEPGQPVAWSEAATTTPCFVTGISADKVVILHRGQEIELGYSDPIGKGKPGQARRQHHD